MISEIKQFLCRAAHTTPSADNSQPWKLSWRDNTLSISYDTQRVENKTFAADSHATLLTIGALSENVTQACTAIGTTVEWTLHEPASATQAVYLEGLVKPADFTLTERHYNHPLFQRHTNRLPFESKALPTEVISLLKNLTVGSNRLVICEDQTDIKAIAQLVRKASEIRFQTQEVHEWLAKSLRFNVNPNDQYGEGLDVTSIDLPPGGSLFLRLISDWRRMNWLNKLGVHKVMAMIDSQPISNAPAVIAVIGPDNHRDTLDAGQLMERAWIALNELNLAVHPYYVVTDQLQRRNSKKVPEGLIKKVDELFEHTQQLLQLKENETLHMLFRVGYPIKAPVKSKRLPLESVCSGIEYEAD